MILRLLLTLILGIFLLSQLESQSSCEDPFADGRPRFDTSYWTLTDFCQRNVDLSEIRSGGVAPDQIPPIDTPRFETIEGAREWLQPQSPVIAVEIEGEARAYPLAILTWHEIANDVIGETPIAVTFCPLCYSALVFDRRVGEDTLRFGVSGLLRNSDMVMWDDLTQSFWQQLTGEGIVGAYMGTELTVIPSQIIGFGDFEQLYPDGIVLSRETGYNRRYGENPYVGYDSSLNPFLFEGEIDDRLPSTELVLGALVFGTPVAYPFSLLSELQVINDVVNDEPVVALWQDGVTSALDQRSIDGSRMVGTAALYRRGLGDQTLTFTLGDDGVIRDDQTGSAWNAFGLATEGELAGQQLNRVMSGAYFWFAWAAFRPETIVYASE